MCASWRSGSSRQTPDESGRNPRGIAESSGTGKEFADVTGPLENPMWLFARVLQVLLKQEGRGHNQVTRTINPSTMLLLPEGGTYTIEVRALSEGGEGAVSAQARVVTSSGKPIGGLPPCLAPHPIA